MSSTTVEAASVILIAGPESKVLLVKRGSGMAFLPNVYVFPGGKVDADDHHLVVESAAITGPLARFAVAALRELQEEVGLSVLSTGTQASITPFAHWVTPKQERRRFDTWFFLLTVPEEAASVPLTLSTGEITDAVWCTVAEALETLPLAPPTYLLLDRLRLPWASLAVADIPRVEPTLRRDDAGRIQLVLPAQSIHLPVGCHVFPSAAAPKPLGTWSVLVVAAPSTTSRL